MTLITYPTRVHFAADVLEAALHSELESENLHSPLLIGAGSLEKSEVFERIQAGLPHGVVPDVFEINVDMPLSVAVEIMREQAEHRTFDLVIAFGSARAIELGRKLRRMLSEKVRCRLPFYAVPGIDGMPNPCTRNLESWRTGLPSVLICDPTLTLGAQSGENLRSSLQSLVRSIESYLAVAYNPTADGMALDAFSRCITNIPRLGSLDDIVLQRELMAAGLNASLSQEKGLGPTQKLIAALVDQGAVIDEVAAAALILPGAIGIMAPDRAKTDMLGKMMGFEGGLDVGHLREFLSDLPFAARLSDLGLRRDQIDAAAKEVEAKYNIPSHVAQDVLDAVY